MTFVRSKEWMQNGSWMAAIWVEEKGKVFCRTVAAKENRQKARDFVQEERKKYMKPEFYQGEGI